MSLQEPEVQFAQRLASNEKPVRTKAIKKLRKYIHVRSQKAADGFTPEELLKLWKGLFYCLWMQDKPLLQEQLSNQISGLIHSFQDVDGQLLYLQSFLQTFKREWTGIDRLRMDKFFQLVRFMFRQTFQMLKKTSWDSSVVSRFLQLLTAQLLQNGCEAPCGLQLHVLDVYLSELAVVAADELTAEQNLVFIQPFCKTAARTKDRTLFGAIRSSVFSAIIDQAPFAIEDLMRELKEADSDPGEAEPREQRAGGAGRKPHMNGGESKEDEADDGEPDPPGDEDVGPVLQFDYGALATRLFELASRSSTPNRNRRQLYGLVRVLRNLSEGIFPPHEVPEEVSTDEDDDMFCSRKRMKRRRRVGQEGEEPAAPKRSRKKKAGSSTSEQHKEPVTEASADSAGQKRRKRKRRRKKSPEEGGSPQPEKSAKDTTEEEPSVRLQADEEEPGARLQQTPPPRKRRGRKGAAEGSHAPSGGEEPAATMAPPAKKRRSQEEAPQAEQGDPIATTTAGRKRSQKGEVAMVTTGKKKKKKSQVGEDAITTATGKSQEGEDAIATATAGKKKMKKKKSQVGEDAIATETAGKKSQEGEDAIATATTGKKKSQVGEDAIATVTTVQQLQPPAAEGEEPREAPGDPTSGSTPVKKKKKKIPVVFEFEADELQTNGDAPETAAPEGGGSPSLGARKTQKKKKCGFVTFQTGAAPTPLFWRSRGGKPQAPRCGSRKVTFGLTNNKTAEFRKSDRSLLVSPDGSSRVPFDPQQKPKFGVLKSPATLRRTPHRAARSRPTAADFF